MSNSDHHLAPEFVDLTARDAKGKTNDQEQSLLRSEDNLPSWRSALTHLLGNVESQLAQRKAERERQHYYYRMAKHRYDEKQRQQFFKDEKDYDRWRASAQHFKSNLQDRLSEQKDLSKQAEVRRKQAGKDLHKEGQRQMLHEYRQLLRKAAFLIKDSGAEQELPEPWSERSSELRDQIEEILYGPHEKRPKFPLKEKAWSQQWPT